MARRKKGEGGGLLLLLVAALFAIAMAGPFALALWLIYCEVAAMNVRHVGNIRDLLDPSERVAVEETQKRGHRIDRRIAEVFAEGDSSGLVRRTDGLFDGRQVEGRELNKRLEKLMAERDAINGRYQNLAIELDERATKWVSLRANLTGARAGLVAFVLTFLISGIGLARSGGAAVDIGALIGLTDGGSGSARLGASIAGMAVAAITIWVARSAARTSRLR